MNGQVATMKKSMLKCIAVSFVDSNDKLEGEFCDYDKIVVRFYDIC